MIVRLNTKNTLNTICTVTTDGRKLLSFENVWPIPDDYTAAGSVTIRDSSTIFRELLEDLVLQTAYRPKMICIYSQICESYVLSGETCWLFLKEQSKIPIFYHLLIGTNIIRGKGLQ